MLTRVYLVSAQKPERTIIEIAAEAIREGKLVIFPTETVYGIAANALDPEAVEKLYQIKSRRADKPFSWHVASAAALEKRCGKLSRRTRSLIRAFWPGPLTLILADAQGEKVGFRMPSHPVALALLKAARVPVVAPSANLSGKPSPVTVEEALADLDGKVELALDAGKTSHEKESTVLDITQTPPRILREGALSRAALEKWFEAHHG